MVEAKVKHLMGAFTKAKVNLALKKGKRKAGAMEAKKRLVKVEKRAEKRSTEARHLAMEAYKASANFSVEKAQVVEAFKSSEKFYDDHIKFSEVTFLKGRKLGRDDYHLLVTAQYLS